MTRAFSLIALCAVGLSTLGCGESSRPTQVASSGQAGNNGGGSAGDTTGGGATEPGQRAKFRIIDPVQDHALQSGEDPLAFDRGTMITSFSSDASTVVVSRPSSPWARSLRQEVARRSA